MKTPLQIFALGILLSALVCNCSPKHQLTDLPPKECIALNDSAVACLMAYPRNVDKAIELYKKAIQCYPGYLTAYFSLSRAYDKKGRYNDELDALDTVLKITNADPTFMVEKGKAFEKMGKSDSANVTYHKAYLGYDKRLKDVPDSYSMISGKINLIALTDGKEKATDEINKQVKLYPSLASKLYIDTIYLNHFNHREMLYGSTGVDTVRRKPATKADSADMELIKRASTPVTRGN